MNTHITSHARARDTHLEMDGQLDRRTSLGLVLIRIAMHRQEVAPPPLERADHRRRLSRRAVRLGDVRAAQLRGLGVETDDRSRTWYVARRADAEMEEEPF